MTLKEFNSLDEVDQANEVINGIFLDCRMELNFIVLLYDLYSFYVEVYYSSTANHILKLKSFRGTQLLDVYLEEIEIDALI
jgi:hypothetical protein